MSLIKFVESVWDRSEKDLDKIEQLRRMLENLKQSENKIYLVTVQSNNV